MRINEFWSVITDVENNEVYIWGEEDFEKPVNNELEILSDYKF